MAKHGIVVLARGPRGVIAGVELVNGECPAEDFLASLNTHAQTQFKARFERLTQIGYLRNPDQMRDLEAPGSPKVWEIKASEGPGWRLYVIQEQTTWLATHGGAKPSGTRAVAKEAKRAQSIYGEWST